MATINRTVSTSDNNSLARPETFGYDHGVRAVRVRGHPEGHCPWAGMAATLAHQLAYAVPQDACTGMTLDVRAGAVKSIAYAVCLRFGLDLPLRSVDDVAGCRHPQGHDPETFRVGVAAIHDGAASLIDAIGAAMTDAGEVELAA